MRKKIIIFIGVIFVIIASCAITHYITFRKSVDMYQVNQWPFQKFFEIKSLEVSKESDVERLSMFNDGLKVHIVIKGECNTYGLSMRPFIKKVHISERLEADENMHKRAIIEVTPVIEGNALDQCSDADYETFPAEYSFDYKLRTFEPSADNVFVIRCGGIDREVAVYQGK